MDLGVVSDTFVSDVLKNNYFVVSIYSNSKCEGDNIYHI